MLIMTTTLTATSMSTAEQRLFKYRLDHHIAMSKALIVGSAGDQRHLTIALHWAQSTLTNLFIQQIPAVL